MRHMRHRPCAHPAAGASVSLTGADPATEPRAERPVRGAAAPAERSPASAVHDLSVSARCGKHRRLDAEPTAQGIRLRRPTERFQSSHGAGSGIESPEMTRPKLSFMDPQRRRCSRERLVQAVGQ
jgi:hypothetical protein